MAITLKKIYQLKIQLLGIKPPIWRRFQVLSSTKLSDFHDICQQVMGWDNYHLHQFSKGGSRYGAIDPDFADLDDSLKNEAKYKLSDLLTSEKQQLNYTYDFGDNWEHKITLEKILPFTTTQKLPVCIKAVRACPPEDVGGIWGYEELLETLADKEHPEYKEMLEWVGENFQPEYYNIEETNLMLQGKIQPTDI